MASVEAKPERLAVLNSAEAGVTLTIRLLMQGKGSVGFRNPEEFHEKRMEAEPRCQPAQVHKPGIIPCPWGALFLHE
ncbi:unnamed protein product [Notodromas monacha]|uniref:Uncharacterized protein n=1 Tax=Notodromas monacha TaxID=399045 RepID=A0A7R9BY29_9CRUS|nr:unnamed protein product [Notodromas monacha]CAG0922365.1 unnamed protein product [Notodromas monacha]